VRGRSRALRLAMRSTKPSTPEPTARSRCSALPGGCERIADSRNEVPVPIGTATRPTHCPVGRDEERANRGVDGGGQVLDEVVQAWEASLSESASGYQAMSPRCRERSG